MIASYTSNAFLSIKINEMRERERERERFCFNRQIRVDCKFLESQHIMDYSLLLGIHFKDQPPKGSSYSQGLDQAVCLRDEMIVPTTISKTGMFYY